MTSRFRLLIFSFLFLAGTVLADNAPFDLTGPPIEVKVDRNGAVLPISQVPNLLEGDKLYIHPELPENQTAHYLLIVTFLRGSTNPPPEQWFTHVELWNKKFHDEGIYVTVPAGALQAVLFLAPETNGDFSTLRSAVRGRPGSFVRAVQDLDQASLDRSRLDTYLAAIHKVADEDPAKIKEVSELLARSLNIRLQDDCYKKPTEEQAACLTQKGGDLILNDGHSQSVVGALTAGPSSDLIGQLSYTPQAGSGYFSPYIGAIVDMGRILDSLHTAQYQYIPALSLPKNDVLELKLNNPPSFHNPKSVIVVALPAISKQQPPPLRLVNPERATCLQKNPLVLETVGAPLAFSTQLLHNMTLQVGKTNLPLTADPAQGGFVVDHEALAKAQLEQPDEAHATLHGQWGFNSFTGPAFPLLAAKETQWVVPAADSAALLEGGAHTLRLQSKEAACVDHVTLKDADGKELKSTWKLAKADELEVAIPAESAKTSGAVTLGVQEYGVSKESLVKLHIFGKPGELKVFTIVSGETHGMLEGVGVKDVDRAEVKGMEFKPDAASLSTGEVRLVTKTAAQLQPNEKTTAHVTLNDGRTVDVPVSVEQPRPRVQLLSKAVELGVGGQTSVIHLSNQSELPLDAQLSFAIKTEQPATFPRGEKIEIATDDQAFDVMLSTKDGLTLQDPKTAVGRLNPAKTFGPSAFGPLKFRAVDENGVAGDWLPLAKLVRVPVLQQLDCPADPNQNCTLKGDNLFLLSSVAADAQFSHATTVPEGFLNATLDVPHAVNGTLYIKLRDDPSDVNQATLPVPAGQP